MTTTNPGTPAVELLPCPFCGGPAVRVNHRIIPPDEPFVGCVDCGAAAPERLWTTRTTPPVEQEGMVEKDTAFLRAWADDINRNAGGHSCDAARLRRIADALAAMPLPDDRLQLAKEALEEANSALQQFRGIQRGNGWDDQLDHLDEAQAEIRQALARIGEPAQSGEGK